MLQEHQVPFFNALAFREILTNSGQVTHVLVAHDNGAGPQRQAVLADVGAANTGNLYFQQGSVGGNLRNFHLPELHCRSRHFQGCQHCFRHCVLLQPGISPTVVE